MSVYEAVLLDEHNDAGSRHLIARTSSGGIELVGQDLNSGPKEHRIFGAREYEWTQTIAWDHVPAFCTLLGGTPGDDVIKLLSERYSGKASDALAQLLRTATFPIKFWSWFSPE